MTTQPDPPRRRWPTVVAFALPAVLLVAVLGGGWAYLTHTAQTRDLRAARELNNFYANYTDDTPARFDQALALCDSPDPEARVYAVLAVVRASPQATGRSERAKAAAARLLDDPEVWVRGTALRALGDLRATEHLDRIRRHLTAADYTERAAAEVAIRQLEPAPPE